MGKGKPKFHGKGKRHRHNIRLANLENGISKSSIRRLARRGGVKRISTDIYDKTRSNLKKFLEKILHDTIILTEHSKRKTVTARDVVTALKHQGCTMYGYD